MIGLRVESGSFAADSIKNLQFNEVAAHQKQDPEMHMSHSLNS